MARRVDGREIVEVPDRAAWRAWLVFHEQGSDGSSPSYDEAVEEALCFGWIDSTVRRLDERRHLQLRSRPKPRSNWSATSKAHVERPAREGRLGAGRRGGGRAGEGGRLLELAHAEPAARRHWSGFGPSSRKAILYWVTSAKRPETRAKRVEQAVRMAAKGLRARFDRERQR